MPRRRRRKKKSRYADAKTENGLEEQRVAAYRAIRALYCETSPLWRVCARGFCRRNCACGGNRNACLKRAWPLMPEQMQKEVCALVEQGGPRRLRPATHRESIMRGRGPLEFVR
jgi:hypothetical protein